MRKHRAWGGFLQRASLVCVQGVSASEQETDLHHPVGGFLSREVAQGPPVLLLRLRAWVLSACG